MEEGLIVSTPSTRRFSSLPAVPRLPLLLHPHRPILFFAHGSEARIFNYESQTWNVAQDGGGNKHLGPTESAESNPLFEEARSSTAKQEPRIVLHSQDLVAADCLCMQCKSRSSQMPVQARRPCTDSAECGGECLWVTAGDDKMLCLWKDESFELLQKRQQRKKVAVLTFGALQSVGQTQRDCAVFVGDRFGEVFCLPLDKVEGVQRFAGDVKVRRMQNLEAIAGVHSAVQTRTTSATQGSKLPLVTRTSNSPSASEEEASDSEEVDMPILAHATTLTCMQIHSPSNLLMTADRDEKIRVCRVNSPWKLESALVGHEKFVTDAKIICVLPSAPHFESREEASLLVVSGGGDCCLRIWSLFSGDEILQVPLALDCLFNSPDCVEKVKSQMGASPTPPNLASDCCGLAILQGALLPLEIYQDTVQDLFIVHTLQLRGLLLLRLDLNPQKSKLISARVVPLPCTVGALLVSRHPLSEVESLDIFEPIKAQMQKLGIQRESVLVGWVVDTEGQLQSPVCLEEQLLNGLSGGASQPPFSALLQGSPIPQVPDSQTDQSQHVCFYWKPTSDPDAPTAEERRAKRLRNKQIQQQHQQQ